LIENQCLGFVGSAKYPPKTVKIYCLLSKPKSQLLKKERFLKNFALKINEKFEKKVVFKKISKELSFCHKLKLSNPYIFTI